MVSESSVNGHVFSVSDLTATVKNLLETNSELRNIRVRGEISNFKSPSSGHLYFSLKDENSHLSCAMFRPAVSGLKFRVSDGLKVIATGSVGVYAPRGNYQLVVAGLVEDGLGDLHKKFVLLKEKLGKEGLFDSKRKKPLPLFPRVVGIVTSPTGAVFHDICKVIQRRFPHVRILLFPCTVQGQDGTPSIVNALQLANSVGEVDVIVLARGGGSLEDLWCFNEEAVARAIFASVIPVVSAVGHETDVTIADFVADVRAPTPSVAGELAVPDVVAVKYELKSMGGKLVSSLQNFVNLRAQRLDDFSGRLGQIIRHLIQYKVRDIGALHGQLVSLNPTAVLNRGFSLTMIGKKIVLKNSQAKKGDTITSILSKGKLVSKIQ